MEIPARMSSKRLIFGLAIVHVVGALAWAQAGTVKVTPLGSRTGDFCAQDRALLFEDPTGVRILYDPGNTVRGGEDSRLGAVDAILISHAHAYAAQRPAAGSRFQESLPCILATWRRPS